MATPTYFTEKNQNGGYREESILVFMEQVPAKGDRVFLRSEEPRSIDHFTVESVEWTIDRTGVLLRADVLLQP